VTKPVHLPGFGAGIGYAEMARMRGPLTRALAKAKENCEPISVDLEATVQMVDELGAAWENRKKVSEVSQKVSLLDPPSFPPVEWVSMSDASTLLDITPQAVGRLRKRGSLHAEPAGRSWRICLESVNARKDGTKCPH
jgi:hypothetical protein